VASVGRQLNCGGSTGCSRSCRPADGWFGLSMLCGRCQVRQMLRRFLVVRQRLWRCTKLLISCGFMEIAVFTGALRFAQIRVRSVRRDVHAHKGAVCLVRSILSALTLKKNLAPGLYADGGGLYLQVSEQGTKAWIFTKVWIFRFTRAKRPRKMG